MKKIALISVLVLMLLACSVSDVSNILSPLFTPTALPSATKTIYVTPSRYADHHGDASHSDLYGYTDLDRFRLYSNSVRDRNLPPKRCC